MSIIEYNGSRGTVYRIKYRDADGRQIMETLGRKADGWNGKRARAELVDRLHKASKGYRRPRQLTLGEYKQTWYEDAAARRGWRQNSLRAHQFTLKRLAPLDHLQLEEIRPRHVSAFVRERVAAGASPTTVAQDLSLLSDLFTTALGQELVDTNPVKGVERPRRGKNRWRILSPAEVSLVLRELQDEPQAHAMFLTLLLTGVRRMELLNLRWRDVDFIDMRIKVVHSKSESGIRSIAIDQRLGEELWQWRTKTNFQGDEEYVFGHPTLGTRSQPEWFGERFQAALKRAGVTDYVRPYHDLRHSSLTHEAAAGSSPIAIMARAGHADMATTKQYLQLAGVVFSDEASALADRLLGVKEEA